MTTHREARAFFDAIAARYDRVYAPSREESRARMARVLAELAPKSRVLDLGVGTGRELSLLLDEGHVVTGMDGSPEMLGRCARRSRAIPLVEGDIWHRLPFEAGSFDAVLALHGTLAHPPSKEALPEAAQEAARVLSSRGVLVVEVPSAAWLDAPRGDGERAVRPTAPGRALITDAATGASIETWLFGLDEWRAALGSSLDVTTSVENGGELFLVARKRRWVQREGRNERR
jgi:SAM-dependent methyltransferase